jgi:mRNA-degrading endonuclease RelE of RelBE toxin-antitoxin system
LPSGSDIRRLRGTAGELRLRVGDWRVRFVVDLPARVVTILAVLPRGQAYKKR